MAFADRMKDWVLFTHRLSKWVLTVSNHMMASLVKPALNGSLQPGLNQEGRQLEDSPQDMLETLLST